mmetsp:Transcript_35437/g.77715  ORF Transcript_35437/g.77715 Transcript_35437/m.77715 type:complete len:498 (+) Transcript_35437:99-1592(+)
MGKKKSAPVKKASSTSYAGRAFEPAPDENKSGGGGALQLSHVLIAALFLAAGILTPPLINWWQSTAAASSRSDGGGDSSAVLNSSADGRVLTEDTGSASSGSLPIRTPCSEENLANFIHDHIAIGMHIVCFSCDADDGDDCVGLTYKYYRNMYTTFQGSVDAGAEAKSSLSALKQSLVDSLSLPLPGPLQQPYALFTPRGERLVGALDELSEEDEEETIASLIKSEMVIIMEGGSWTWPGVRIGFTRTIDLYSIMPGPPGTRLGGEEKKRTAEIETLSLKPLVVSVKGFIEPDECDYIQEEAGPHMRYSGVSLMDKDKGRPASDWRTSQSTFLHATNDTPVLYEIEQRTASLTRIPRQNQEDTQVLRYGHSEKYDAHHDFFNPELYQSSPGTLELIENGRRNRQATVFWYLSDVAKGGETVFPRFGGAPQPHDFKDCTKGLRVRPEKGKVIIFYDLLPNGKMDDLSLHGGCPVIDGVKWAANKWVWNAEMQYVNDVE